MTFKEYIDFYYKAADERAASKKIFAKKLDLGISQIQSIYTGARRLSPQAAIKLHLITQGEISIFETRPDIYPEKILREIMRGIKKTAQI
jgi:DNA-binding transcriptional regulator YdaS (Cro superfamily)